MNSTNNGAKKYPSIDAVNAKERAKMMARVGGKGKSPTQAQTRIENTDCKTSNNGG